MNVEQQNELLKLVNTISSNNNNIAKGIEEIKFNFIADQVKGYYELFEQIFSTTKDYIQFYDSFLDTIEDMTRDAIKEANSYSVELSETETHIDNYNCMLRDYQKCNRNINLLSKYL